MMMYAIAYVDLLGFAAGGTTIIAFACRKMLALRLVAIIANILFIAYGLTLGLVPIMVLHCILLPLNLFRLFGFLSVFDDAKLRRKRGPSPNATTGPRLPR